jgi:hypothetical protein
MRRPLIALSALTMIIALSIGVNASATANGSSQPVAAYSLVTPIGASPSGLVARAIMPAGAQCPRLKIVRHGGGHQSVAMYERKAPATTGAAFAALTACTADIPAGAAQAFIGTTLIPSTIPRRVESLAILGDTGCRMKGSTFQDCADVDAWPLARIASSIAKDQPDVVVFTGDFFYREAACPDDKSDLCGGSPAPIKGMPFKDTAFSWLADVFTPMAPWA